MGVIKFEVNDGYIYINPNDVKTFYENKGKRLGGLHPLALRLWKKKPFYKRFFKPKIGRWEQPHLLIIDHNEKKIYEVSFKSNARLKENAEIFGELWNDAISS